MTPKGKKRSSRAETSTQRGPKRELSDEVIRSIREELVHAFEGYWGEIGLELRRCKRPDDIIPIFEVFKSVYIWNRLSYFCRRTSERPDWRSVRKLRKSLKATRGDRYKWDRVAAERKQDWQDAQRALASVKRNRRRLVRRELKKRQRRFAEASQEHRRLHDEEDRLQQQLDHFESAFARQELFDFVKSKRYEVTPLNLANAIAGLPYTRWRQSMRRCVSHESTRANGEDSVGVTANSPSLLIVGSAGSGKTHLLCDVAKNRIAKNWPTVVLLIAPFAFTSGTYYAEKNSFDCSVDKDFTVFVPEAMIVEKMGLRWNGIDGRFFDNNNNLVAFDPATCGQGPHSLLVSKDLFLEFLRREKYEVMWFLLAGKQIFGGHYGSENWLGELQINGGFRIKSRKVIGKISSKFINPKAKSRGAQQSKGQS